MPIYSENVVTSVEAHIGKHQSFIHLSLQGGFCHYRFSYVTVGYFCRSVCGTAVNWTSIIKNPQGIGFDM